MLFLIANDVHRHRASIPRTERMTEVAGVMNWLIVHSDDYVSRAKTCFVGSAAFLHRTDQNPIPVFYSEKFTELRSDVLDHQTATRRGMHHHDRCGHVEIGQ